VSHFPEGSLRSLGPLLLGDESVGLTFCADLAKVNLSITAFREFFLGLIGDFDFAGEPGVIPGIPEVGVVGVVAGDEVLEVKVGGVLILDGFEELVVELLDEVLLDDFEFDFRGIVNPDFNGLPPGMTGIEGDLLIAPNGLGGNLVDGL